MRTKIIHKKTLHYLIRDTAVIIFDKLQATSYDIYTGINKPVLKQFRKILENSAYDEYDTWVDIVDLSCKMGIRGNGTAVRQEWFFES